MLHIDRLNLILPSGMEPHAAYIAHRVGSLLTKVELNTDRYVEHLAPPPIAVGLDSTPGRIADKIAQHITDALRRT